MARMARVVVPGMPHHIVQRGNRRLDVFFSDDDRWAYITFLRSACQRYGVAIWAYCLMRNHVHLVAVPTQADSLARCFADAHVHYTRRINRRKGWQGHLWQARFNASVLDQPYLLAAVRYVERNPVRVGVAKLPWHYPWSSARWHMGLASRDPLVRGDETLRGLISDWEEYLRTAEQDHEVATIDRETRVSRPLGSRAFIQRLERHVGRRLIRGRPGRRWPKRK